MEAATTTKATKKRQAGYLNKKQLETIKEKLLSEKERILNKESVDRARYHLDKEELSDPVDEASANMQASQEIRFATRETFLLKKINSTLLRLNDADFGKCDECDAEIGFERLLARPVATQCITCKEESENNEKNNFYDRRSKSLGKTISELGRP